MQAIELHAYIDENHQIQVQVPSEWPPQEVKVIVLAEPPEPIRMERRVFGQFRGKIHSADDFDAELPDTFWLGESS